MSTDPLDNNGRADFAATALAAYYDETRHDGGTYGDEGSEEFNDTFGDLLGDLQHLARRAGLDFGELMERGTRHFEEEVQEEEALAEEERIRMGAAPVDEKVYEAMGENFNAFQHIHFDSGVDRRELRWSLLRLQKAGRVEWEAGLGWRRTPAPTTEEAPAAAPARGPKALDVALREIAVHLALTPEWDSQTIEGVGEVVGLTGLPSIGDMQEVNFWVAEAIKLGVWGWYKDAVVDWAELNEVKLMALEERERS